MQALLAAFPTGRTVVLLDNFEDAVDGETRALRDAELDEALRCPVAAAPARGQGDPDDAHRPARPWPWCSRNDRAGLTWAKGSPPRTPRISCARWMSMARWGSNPLRRTC